MKDYRVTGLVVISILLLCSSCASVFQGRNYSHLNYVKVKKERTFVEAPASELASDGMSSLVVRKERLDFSTAAAVSERKQIQLSEADRGALRIPSGRVESSKADELQSVVSLSARQEKGMGAAQTEIFAGMDHDLRLALIFLIGGLLLALLVFIPYVGWVFGVAATISVIIGLVYLIKYIVEKG